MDRNSSFFHAKMSEHQEKSKILRIFDSNGQQIDDEEAIANQFIQFYYGLLGTSSENLRSVDVGVLQSSLILTENHRSLLSAEVTSEEIQNALFSISNDKALGPDMELGFF